MRKDNPTLTFDELYEKVCTYIKKEADRKMISRAYLFAYEKHFGQKRLTGEDYIVHPLNVAYILAEISADAQTICAAVLHDTIEDCDVTYEDIEKKFSKEIANLVNGVTKINKLKFTCDNEAVIANHRKIIVGLSEDVRILIIKLADRLHNMRTLWIMSEKSQKANAKETLDILTPIAHRLGMNQIKSELEDLSLRYYKPDVYFSIVEKLNQTRKERDRIVEEMMERVSEILNKEGINHEIKGRAKSIFSIYKKLDSGRKFSDIYDLLALRVFVNNEQECYQTLGIIHSKYRPIPKRFKDFVAMPKTNMYQSLHTTVFGLEGFLFEIQIRTHEMDEIAERGIASHWSYKENHGSGKVAMQNAMEQKLQFFREIMELKDEESNDEEFVRSVQEDVLKNTIYVFTPKGDVIELPQGATPIDFAYRVHSGVGDTMVGALVNGNIVSLDYVLNDGDIIKINNNKNSSGPSREWIDIAFTSQAKNKIKSFYNKIDKEGYLKTGTEILQKEVRKRKIPFADFYSTDNINKIFEEFHVGDMTELHINIGNGKFTPIQIVNSFFGDTRTKEEIILDKVTKTEIKKISVKNDIIVEGIDEIKVNIAACCKPIPGDNIVGYISKGKGINVHRTVCPNISELEERMIDVAWNTDIMKKYTTDILIKASDSQDLLLAIISKTSGSEITIQSINTMNNNNNRYIVNLNILVGSTEKLDKFMNDLMSITNIVQVERDIK
jgi:(p)ppGpp synthetase, RelA/SpoT family